MYQATIKEGVGSHNGRVSGETVIINESQLRAFGDKFENVQPVEIEYSDVPTDEEIKAIESIPPDLPDLSGMSANAIVKAVDAGDVDPAAALDWLKKNKPRSKTAQRVIGAKL